MPGDFLTSMVAKLRWGVRKFWSACENDEILVSISLNPANDKKFHTNFPYKILAPSITANDDSY